MKGNTIKVLYGVLALAVVAYWVSTRDNDQRQVERRLDELRALVEKEAGEADLVAANNARRLGEMFTRDFAVYLQPMDETVTDRQRVMQVMLQYRREGERIAVAFRDQEIEIRDLGGEKVASVALVAVVHATVAGEPTREGFRFTFEWRREDSEWRMSQVTLVEILEGRLLF